MGRKAVVAVCCLNQWALDFQGNFDRILESIRQARKLGASYRSGPELEICGYSCEDHFLESDTLLHSWEVLADLISHDDCQGMLFDVGMPVMFRNVTYNCRVAVLNRRVLLIRPKTKLCDDGCYRESRWFTAWTKERTIEDYFLPRMISSICYGQKTCPFGDGVLSTVDTCIGYEICEELWNPMSNHISMSLDGVEIIVNGSASYFELRKAYVTVDLVRAASAKCGGCYVFSDLRGCDGGRVYFNGSSCVAVNGFFVARTKQFALEEVEVAHAVIDLEDIRTYRNSIRSRNVAASQSPAYPRVQVDYALSEIDQLCTVLLPPSPRFEWTYHSADEEIAMAPACWLWDYLRRSNQGGFFLPLSGGVDSASVAAIVYSMCQLLHYAAGNDLDTLSNLRTVLGDKDYIPDSTKELCNKLLVTCYMATENSSKETRERAQALADDIGSNHLEINIDDAVTSVLSSFEKAMPGCKPKYKVHGGTDAENLALQNLQARLRMVHGYLLAQLYHHSSSSLDLEKNDNPRMKSLLVLGSGNVDEALRGYLTKYDCSSADINPIGGISKTDLKSFLKYAETTFGLKSLSSILDAPPTAELVPLSKKGCVVQTDEQEMGMTYDDLSKFGRLRKQQFCGPLSMFTKIIETSGDTQSLQQIAEQVKHFFRYYAINRHKMTVLTPSMHAETYSPDDNRFDLRPFLYPVSWSWQFRAINRQVRQYEQPCPSYDDLHARKPPGPD